MCESCGNPDCDGPRYFALGNYNLETGEFTPVNMHPTAAYDQMMTGVTERLHEIVYGWRNAREKDDKGDFDEFMNLMAYLAESFPPPVILAMLSTAIVRLETSKVIGKQSNLPKPEGVE